VLDLIEEARAQGAAVLGTVHDPVSRERIATRTITLEGAAA
jgi:alpha-D-ribose 1-methylphosphonate 5-triphosphate synthase subunit PhnL